MPTKYSSKPSYQSLKSRGLPLDKKAKLPNNKGILKHNQDIEDKQQRQIYYPNISSDSEQTINSLRNGLDKCADLLSAIIGSPQGMEQKEENVRKPSKKVKIKTPPPPLRTPNKHLRNVPPYNRRLTASTPIYTRPTKCLNSIVQVNDIDQGNSEIGRKKQSTSNNNSIDLKKLLDQKYYLENVLIKIEKDRNEIQKKYNEMLKENQNEIQDQKEFPEKSNTNEKTSNNIEVIPGNSPTQNNLVPKNKNNFIDKNISSELEGIVNRITGNLTTPLGNDKKEIENFKENTVLKPRLITPLNSSVEELQIPSYRSSTSSVTISGISNTIIDENKRKQKIMKYDAKNEKEPCKFGKSRNDTPHVEVQITTLNYLIEELKKLLARTKDESLEVNHLLGEIDHIVGLLPFLLNQQSNRALIEPTNIEAVFTENEELRRQLKLIEGELQQFINQIQQAELEKNKENKEHYAYLEKKLNQEEELRLRLSKEIEDTNKVTKGLQQENEALLKLLSDKENEFLMERKEIIHQNSQLKRELSQHQSLIEEQKLKIQAVEKECTIKEIALQQRDAEITRLSNLNQDLQQSVTTLLEDLKQERCKYSQQLPTFINRKNNNDIHSIKSPLRRYQGNIGATMIKSANHRNVGHVTSHFDDQNTRNEYPVWSNSSNDFSSTSITDMQKETSLSTLRTFENSEFRKEIDILDSEISRIQKSLKTHS